MVIFQTLYLLITLLRVSNYLNKSEMLGMGFSSFLTHAETIIEGEEYCIIIKPRCILKIYRKSDT